MQICMIARPRIVSDWPISGDKYLSTSELNITGMLSSLFSQSFFEAKFDFQSRHACCDFQKRVFLCLAE